MSGSLITIKVENKSKSYVGRGGTVFPPSSTKTVRVSRKRAREISAHVNLKVVEVVEDKKAEEESTQSNLDATNEQNTEEVSEAEEEEEEETESDEEGEEDNFIELASQSICPYCEEQLKSMKGLTSHVRIKHPDEYGEFKERIYEELDEGAGEG